VEIVLVFLKNPDATIAGDSRKQKRTTKNKKT